MSEPRFERVMDELRETAPAAPEGLRERIAGLPVPTARRPLRWRPALAAAVAIGVAVGLGAAAIGGLRGSHTATRESVPQGAQPAGALFERQPGTAAKAAPRALQPYPDQGRTALAPGSRIQKYDVFMNLRVKSLSRATQSAVRTTRGLGGYVAGANYTTSGNSGDSQLDLRVPIHRVQRAIATFTGLGTILSQRIAVTDLQAGVDRLGHRIAALRATVARLERKQRQVGLTPQEQGELAGTRSNIKRLAEARETLVRNGAYAEISLVLTTRKAAAKQEAPGRFDRFWGDAGDILGKEAIIVLYALVVAGPFLLLAALALLGERVRRRRSNNRLLEESA
jgi:uncharacterized protein DUF4349